jgi:hypothetical protein
MTIETRNMILDPHQCRHDEIGMKSVESDMTQKAARQKTATSRSSLAGVRLLDTDDKKNGPIDAYHMFNGSQECDYRCISRAGASCGVVYLARQFQLVAIDCLVVFVPPGLCPARVNICCDCCCCDGFCVCDHQIEAGMNVARFSLNQGSYEYHAGVMQSVREAAARTGKPCAILLDTTGPEIRTGKLLGGQVTLQAGQSLVITTDKGAIGTGTRVPNQHCPIDLVCGFIICTPLRCDITCLVPCIL